MHVLACFVEKNVNGECPISCVKLSELFILASISWLKFWRILVVELLLFPAIQYTFQSKSHVPWSYIVEAVVGESVVVIKKLLQMQVGIHCF